MWLSLEGQTVNAVKFVLCQGGSRLVLPDEHSLLLLAYRCWRDASGMSVNGQFSGHETGMILIYFLPGRQDDGIFLYDS